MFDRFTDRARKVMGLSRQEAQRLRHDYIGTEHILLGLILEGGGVAGDILKNLDVDPKRIREEVERLVIAGTAPATMGRLPFTPRAKKVFEFSLQEASGFGHAYIGTEHLLLGLIREEEGIAATVLAKLNVRVEDAREEIVELLGEAATSDRADPDPLNLPARRAMNVAAEQAHRFRHDQIGTEHILLGLLEEGAGGGVLWKLLTRRVREETEKLMVPGAQPVAKAPVASTQGAKAVLDLAFKAAGELGHAKVGAEHLILGLIREKEGIAARVLAAAGITADEVLDAIRPTPPEAKPARAGRPSFYSLPDRSRAALVRARLEAQRFHHDHIGTEHLLLGLVAEGGAAAEVLKTLCAEPARVRADAERRITCGSTMVTAGQFPFTPAMKRVLELTLEEANSLGADSIREEHLLLGLIREEKGIAAQVLAALGVTLESARREIVSRLGPRDPPG